MLTKSEPSPVAPVCEHRIDGGYGWVVAAASFLAHFFQYGVVWSVGVFYVLFMENVGGDRGAVALISSLNTATFYVTGPLAATLTNKFGCRPVAMAGGLIGSLGLVLSVFANNIYHLYLTFGVLTGFGLGLSFIPTVSIVGFYFEKKRSLALGIAVSGVGMGTFAFPPIIRILVHMFSWRGAILITGGLCLNLVVCGALYRPITILIDENKNEFKQKDNGWFNFDIFRNVRYIFLAINNLLVTFGLSVIYVHFAAYASCMGYSDDAAAMLFSALGIANFAGRIAYGWLGQLPRVRSLHLYTISLMVAGIATALCPLVTSYGWLVTYAVVFGFTTAALGTLLPIIIMEILSVELLPSGYGYILVFEAIGTLVGGPVAGELYQWSAYYPASLYLGACTICMSAVLMIYPCVFDLTPPPVNLTDIDEKQASSKSLINEFASSA